MEQEINSNESIKIHNFDGLVREKEKIYEITVDYLKIFLQNVDNEVSLIKVENQDGVQ